MAAHVRGKGIVVFTACSHAGVINVLKHAQSSFSTVPLYAVVVAFTWRAGTRRSSRTPCATSARSGLH